MPPFVLAFALFLAASSAPVLALGPALASVLPLGFEPALATGASPCFRADTVAHPERKPAIPTMIPAHRRRLTRLLMLRGHSTRGVHPHETQDRGCIGRRATNGGSGRNSTARWDPWRR